MSAVRVEWYPAARSLGPGARAAVEEACALLAEEGARAAASGSQPRGIARVDADGVDVALKLGRRRGARGALLPPRQRDVSLLAGQTWWFIYKIESKNIKLGG